MATGKELYRVPTAGFSYGVALSADGKWALVSSDDGEDVVYMFAQRPVWLGDAAAAPGELAPTTEALYYTSRPIAPEKKRACGGCARAGRGSAHGSSLLPVSAAWQRMALKCEPGILTKQGVEPSAFDFASKAAKNAGKCENEEILLLEIVRYCYPARNRASR